VSAAQEKGRGWAGTRNGPGNVGRMRKEKKGADWAGLAVWAENEFSYFSFLQTVQTNSS